MHVLDASHARPRNFTYREMYTGWNIDFTHVTMAANIYTNE
jgi:hypothetical protein